MKDEIKEINNRICKNCKYHYIEEISFDYPQSCCNKTKPNHTTEKWLNCDNFEYSDDYITNLQEEIQKKEAMYDSLAVSYRLEQEENERLNNIINKTTKLLKQAGSYDEETKQFCDDVWEELPDILSVLEGSDK